MPIPLWRSTCILYKLNYNKYNTKCWDGTPGSLTPPRSKIKDFTSPGGPSHPYPYRDIGKEWSLAAGTKYQLPDHHSECLGTQTSKEVPTGPFRASKIFDFTSTGLLIS